MSQLIGKSVRISRVAVLCGFLLAGTLSGCAASGPRFEPLAPKRADAVEIFVYRTPNGFTRLVNFTAYLDQTKVGSLNDAGYISMRPTPGIHVIRLGGGALDRQDFVLAAVPLQAGDRRFYRITFGAAFSNDPGWHIAEVSERRATEELKNLRRSD